MVSEDLDGLHATIFLSGKVCGTMVTVQYRDHLWYM